MAHEWAVEDARTAVEPKWPPSLPESDV